MKVFLFIVNYNSDVALIEYLESIRVAQQVAGPSLQLSIQIVDNSVRATNSRAEFTERIKAAGSAEVVFAERNLGYFGAVPLGQARAAELAPDIVIVSNADLLLTAEFFVRLAQARTRDFAIIAPAIITDRGTGFDQNPKVLQRYPKRKLRLLQTVYSAPLLLATYLWLGRLRERRRNARMRSGELPQSVAGPIYAAHGAMFIFSRPESFLGLPPYEPFLYGEELFVAEETRRAGHRSVYEPKIRVLDARHASTGMLGSAARRKLLRKSIEFILRQYYQ
jgi:GT2 family glycosyltransferase